VRRRADAGRVRDRDPAIRCAACGYVVTDRAQRFAVNGHARHAFVNPAGLVFEIACFRAAPGCCRAGKATGNWTWFPGYAWRLALCARCGEHLGWAYQGEAGAFFGLIVDRLREDAGRAP